MKKLNLKKYSSILALILAPSIAFSQVGLSKLAEDQSFSIINIVPKFGPDYSGLKNEIASIQSEMSSIKDDIAKSALENMFQPQGLTSALDKLSKEIQQKIDAKIKSIKSKLPESDGPVFSTYVMPFNTSLESVDRVEVPLIGETQVINIDLEKMSKKEIDSLGSDLRVAINSLPVVENEKFQLTAMAIHFKLQKDYSEVLIQVLGELKSGVSDFYETNDKVNLTKLEILSNASRLEKPMVLINLKQKFTKYLKDDESPITQFNISFGSFSGFNGGSYGSIRGEMQILKDVLNGDKKSCEINLNSVPSLTGQFVEPTKVLALDALLKGKKVRFRIQSINIDPKTLKVANMDVATGIENYNMLQCLPFGMVGAEFTGKANDKIDTLLQSMVMQNDLTNEMVDSLLL